MINILMIAKWTSHIDHIYIIFRRIKFIGSVTLAAMDINGNVINGYNWSNSLLLLDVI